ncbi:hypothetical protein H6G96_31545 [Nostoc sp. FACHB-892]|nr:hypothetical protein [Nostoc sp. FACHB-892]
MPKRRRPPPRLLFAISAPLLRLPAPVPHQLPHQEALLCKHPAPPAPVLRGWIDFILDFFLKIFSAIFHQSFFKPSKSGAGGAEPLILRCFWCG